MLHQQNTAEEIVYNLQRGANTFVLGDPVGAGKTYEAIMVFLKLRELNPDLGMIVTVPDTVISDWLEALSSAGITSYKIILDPKSVSTLDIHNLPPVLFVKHNLSLYQSPVHQIAMKKLEAVYALPRVHVFDEKKANSTIAALYNCAENNLRLILSGTVVTNSVQDLSVHFEGAKQLGAARIKKIMEGNSDFFCRFFTSTFFGIDPSTPGNKFFDFLDLSTLLHRYFFSRMSSNLPICLPQFLERIVLIDSTSIAGQCPKPKIHQHPTVLLSGVGARVAVDQATNQLFLDSHLPVWYSAKFHRLQAECAAPRDASKPIDILVVTSSQRTSDQLLRDLKPIVATLNYCCIFIRDINREEKINAARDKGLSVIFITETNCVEGFNIQQYLAKIIFFDAVREAGVYAQAVGRGVRQGNLSADVEVKQYCTNKTGDYVAERVIITRKAKGLLELIHADPAAIFLLLTLDVLTRQLPTLRSNVDFRSTILSIHMALKFLRTNLATISDNANSHQVVNDLIGILTFEKYYLFDLMKWRLTYQADPASLSSPFVHFFLFEEEMLRFAFDEVSTEQFRLISQAIARGKDHFLRSIE